MKRSSRLETSVSPRFLWGQFDDFMGIFAGFWGGGGGGGGSDNDDNDDDYDFRKCDLGSCGNFLLWKKYVEKGQFSNFNVIFGKIITCSYEEFFKTIRILQGGKHLIIISAGTRPQSYY